MQAVATCVAVAVCVGDIVGVTILVATVVRVMVAGVVVIVLLGTFSWMEVFSLPEAGASVSFGVEDFLGCH